MGHAHLKALRAWRENMPAAPILTCTVTRVQAARLRRAPRRSKVLLEQLGASFCTITPIKRKKTKP